LTNNDEDLDVEGRAVMKMNWISRSSIQDAKEKEKEEEEKKDEEKLKNKVKGSN
jgi:hypothetical protein